MAMKKARARLPPCHQLPRGRRASPSRCHIGIPEGREQSFAQTRSFAGMLVAAQAVAAMVADDSALLAARQAARPGRQLISRAQPLAQRWGEDETIKRITISVRPGVWTASRRRSR